MKCSKVVLTWRSLQSRKTNRTIQFSRFFYWVHNWWLLCSLQPVIILEVSKFSYLKEVIAVKSGWNRNEKQRTWLREAPSEIPLQHTTLVSLSYHMEWKQNSTAASEVAGSSASSLTRGSWPVRTSDHQKLVPTFRWIDNFLAVTKRDFLKNGSVITIKREIPKWKCRIRMAGCLP